MVEAFISGVILALGLVIPLGPQNAFIFNQSSLQTRYSAVLPVVMASALCDAGLILLAVFGIDFLLPSSQIRVVISLLGACFLAFWGCKMWKASKSPAVFSQASQMSVGQQIAFTLSVSLLNPHAIMDAFLVIGTISMCYIGLEKHIFTCACILTDILWFVFLSLFGFYLKNVRNGLQITMSINKLSAIIMWYIALQTVVDVYSLISNKTL